MYYVYVLQAVDDPERFYLGYSTDLRRRVDDHNRGNNASTRGTQWRLVFYEAYLTKVGAAKRERVLKGDGRSRRHLMKRIREMLEADASGAI